MAQGDRRKKNEALMQYLISIFYLGCMQNRLNHTYKTSFNQKVGAKSSFWLETS